MNVSQMNGSLTNLMSDPTEITRHIYGVSPKPKSQPEIMQIIEQVIEGIIQAADGIGDFDDQWEQDDIKIELKVSVKIDLTGLTERKDDQPPAPSASFPSTQDREEKMSDQAVAAKEECRDMIRTAINELFRHSKFHDDTLMAQSPLHTLTVVKEACQTFMREQGIVPSTLCKRDKAVILRRFLIKCLNHDLHPTTAPKEGTPDVKEKWREYLILHHQYVEGWSRQEVTKELSRLDLWTTSKRYTQVLKSGREQLSTIIWQKEMWVRKGKP